MSKLKNIKKGALTHSPFYPVKTLNKETEIQAIILCVAAQYPPDLINPNQITRSPQAPERRKRFPQDSRCSAYGTFSKPQPPQGFGTVA